MAPAWKPHAQPEEEDGPEEFAFDGPRLIGRAFGMDGDVDNFDARYDVADAPSWEDSETETDSDRNPAAWLHTPAELGFTWNRQRGDWWRPTGYQEKKVRRPRKRVPMWMRTKQDFERVIMAHPQAKTLAGVWRRVTYLFWNLQYGAREVAATMAEERHSLSEAMVWRIIRMLKRRAKRLDQNVGDAVAAAAEMIERDRAAEELFSKGQTVRQVSKALLVSVGKAEKLRKRWLRRHAA